MIGIVNYGAGNLKSVEKAFKYLKIRTRIIENKFDFKKVKKVVLPGVGSFGFAMENLKKRDLITSLENWVDSGKSFLGICLGMQLLLEESDESSGSFGLSKIKGNCEKFKKGIVPQIGWNNVNQIVEDNLFKGIENDSFFYFVHSFFPNCNLTNFAIGKTNYYIDFPSVLKVKNSYGVQFHPEKSGEIGIKLLKNWVELC